MLGNNNKSVLLRTTIVTLAVISTLAFTVFADTIILKSGKKIEGTITESAEKYVKIDISGITLSYWRDEIESIEGEKKSSSTLLTKPESTTTQDSYQESYDQGTAYYKNREYEKAVPLLEQALFMFSRIPDMPTETVSMLHYMLTDSYNEIGQIHYFTGELCLRIIYHNEQFFNLQKHLETKDEHIEFLRKTIGHYDVAVMAKNVRMMEQGGDGKEFELPPDTIALEEKIRSKDRALEVIKAYDSAKKDSLFKTEPSDKTPQDVINALDSVTEKITSIHFKKTIKIEEKNELLEEVFYKKPDKFKAIQSDNTSIIVANKYYVIATGSKKIIDRQDVSFSELDIFKGLCIPNFTTIKKYFHIKAEKIKGCPEFLKNLYKKNETPEFYLITAHEKDPNNNPFYPPIAKFEYIVDVKLGLPVSIKEYWLGIIGSGKKEELAKETVVKKIDKYADGLCLPTEGLTQGYAEELKGFKEYWHIEIVSINKNLNDAEFDVTKYDK